MKTLYEKLVAAFPNAEIYKSKTTSGWIPGNSVVSEFPELFVKYTSDQMKLIRTGHIELHFDAGSEDYDTEYFTVFSGTHYGPVIPCTRAPSDLRLLAKMAIVANLAVGELQELF